MTNEGTCKIIAVRSGLARIISGLRKTQKNLRRSALT